MQSHLQAVFEGNAGMMLLWSVAIIVWRLSIQIDQTRMNQRALDSNKLLLPIRKALIVCSKRSHFAHATVLTSSLSCGQLQGILLWGLLIMERSFQCSQRLAAGGKKQLLRMFRFLFLFFLCSTVDWIRISWGDCFLWCRLSFDLRWLHEGLRRRSEWRPKWS